MKFIITESQNSKLWVLRRYGMIKKAFKETIAYMEFSDNPCKYNSFNEYEKKFYHILMDELHPHYYENNNFDYEGVMLILRDLFYVDLTEYYYSLDC